MPEVFCASPLEMSAPATTGIPATKRSETYLSRMLTDAIRTAKGEEDCPQFTSVRPAGGGV
jgi:hypothetical protein